MLAKINEFLKYVASIILSILPDSPLRPYIEQLEVSSWVGYLNYFVPVGTFFAIGTAWTAAITIFYTYQMILRWAKVVGD